MQKKSKKTVIIYFYIYIHHLFLNFYDTQIPQPHSLYYNFLFLFVLPLSLLSHIYIYIIILHLKALLHNISTTILLFLHFSVSHVYFALILHYTHFPILPLYLLLYNKSFFFSFLLPMNNPTPPQSKKQNKTRIHSHHTQKHAFLFFFL
jgi:hypothetical protein